MAVSSCALTRRCLRRRWPVWLPRRSIAVALDGDPPKPWWCDADDKRELATQRRTTQLRAGKGEAPDTLAARQPAAQWERERQRCASPTTGGHPQPQGPDPGSRCQVGG